MLYTEGLLRWFTLSNAPCSPLLLSLCRALYLSMKDTDKGIKEQTLEKDKKVFNHCFTGKMACAPKVGNRGRSGVFSRSYLCAPGCGTQECRMQTDEQEIGILPVWRQKPG